MLFGGNRVTNSSDPSLDVTSGCGGAVFTNCDHVNMTVSLTSNFAPGVGGALHFNRSKVVVFYNINAINNTVDLYYCGVISVFLCKQAILDGDNYFVNNSAHTYGGAGDIYLVDTMKINYFQGNRADS